ncbi:MAG: hypothetical protein K8T90_00550 [Planctomycetes bacterium]|nr:hypothetical protein [Planctomycetota bacterium]
MSIGLASCASGVPAAPDPALGPTFADIDVRPRPRIEEGAARGIAAARRLAALGRRGEAFSRLTQVLSAYPGALEAERALQDVLAGSRSDAWLRRRAERRLRAEPGSADANYLAARIEPSRVRQAMLFDRALAVDPGHPWARLGRAITLDRTGRFDAAIGEAWRVAAGAPWLDLPWTYLGQTALSRGAPDAAERFLLEAVARGADDPRPWIALASVYDDLDQGADASRAALEAFRRAPGDAGITWGLGRILERLGTGPDVEAVLRAADDVRSECARTAALDVFRGRILVSVGRFEEARSALLDAQRDGASPGDVAVPLRRARIGAARVQEAVDCYLADLPGDVTDVADTRAPAWSELVAAGSAWRDNDAAAAVRLAAALRSVGWLDELRIVLTRARSQFPEDAELAQLSAESDAFALFLEELGAYARELRRLHRRGVTVPLDDLVGRIREISIARLGRDVSDGIRVTSYPFIGAFASSDTSAGAFHDVFVEHGLLAVAGERSGRGAELLLGRVVSDRPDRQAVVLGEPVVCDEHWIESDGLPDGLAGLRSGMAGLTLDRLVLLQLDVIRHLPPEDDPDIPYLALDAGADGPGEADVDDALRSVATPSGVAVRIDRAVAARDPTGALALDAVLRHELVHVLDAARMLPPWRHMFRVLAFVAGHGFDGAAIESALEAHAAVGSIVDADEPRAALESLLAFLPAEAGDTAHVSGYHRAVAVAIDEIVSDPLSFQSIDLRWNVLQQMDRLTADEVRELGRRVLRRIQ